MTNRLSNRINNSFSNLDNRSNVYLLRCPNMVTTRSNASSDDSTLTLPTALAAITDQVHETQQYHQTVSIGGHKIY